MALLFNETRGWQRVKTKYEQIKQAIEFESWYAQKKQDDIWECVRRCRTRKTTIIIVQVEKVTIFGGILWATPRHMQWYERQP
jgi:hypothetical protein